MEKERSIDRLARILIYYKAVRRLIPDRENI